MSDEKVPEDSGRPVLETFRPCLGEEFQLQLDDGSVTLKLIEATPLPPATKRTDLDIRQDPFSLIFKTGEDIPQLPQQTYEINHQTIGTTLMFIVPVGFGEYQAIFN